MIDYSKVSEFKLACYNIKQDLVFFAEAIKELRESIY